MGRLIAAAAYSAGRKVADIGIGESGEWAARAGHFVWIGIEAPDEEDLRQLQVQFGLHELAIEDALNAHQRPKLEAYGETTFVVLRTAFLVDGHIALGETEIFVGRGYIITVRHGASASYARVRQCAEAAPKQLAHGEDYVLYALIDFIVDNYLAVVEQLAAEVQALEEQSWRRSTSSGSPASTSCGASCRGCAWWWRRPPRSAAGSSTPSCRASTSRSGPTTATSSTM